MVAEFNLEENVEFLGRITHEQSLRFQASCDALLLTSSMVIGGHDYSIAGKTFEYLSIQKPIVGFVTEGAQKRLLTKTGVALICNPDDPDAAATGLADLLSGRWQTSPDIEFLNGFHRRALTKSLSEIIQRVTQGSR
jgi:glycosyltransferase involved in cell wall biosynthesis